METDLRPALKTGFLGAVTVIYVSMVGMIETFGQRDMINGVISLGLTLLILIMTGTGFMAARALDRLLNPVHEPERVILPRSRAVRSGALGGLLVGFGIALLVLLDSVVGLREVFVNVSPAMIEIVTFGLGSIVGAVVLVVLGTLLGILGGWTYVLPNETRQPIVMGFLWLAFIGMLSDLIRVSLSRPGFPPFLSRIFTTSNGLTAVGAITVIAIIVAWTLYGRRRRKATSEQVSEIPTTRQRNRRLLRQGAIVLLLLLLPLIVGVFPSEVLVNIGLYVLMGFGINIVVGMAGLLDLGYVAFFAVGAYAMAFMTTAQDVLGGPQISFWLALPIVIAITGFAGLLVGAPVLRMRGDYLAIVTLGFGEIARFLALSDWFKPVLGGAQGIIKIPDISIGGLEIIGPQKLYYLFLIGSVIALFISWRIKDSRVGRAWMAMREDEQVADAMGINTVYYKLLAFAMGAMIASVSGALFAAKLGTIFPHSFNVLVSITALSLLIVGGIGSLPGVIVGAVVLVGLPELLREFSEFRLLLYGALLIVMMIVRPEGFLPSVRRARELVEEDREQDLVFAVEEPAVAAGNPE
ncbi:MAG: branched-chain amino acid ABC transporter permease [Anaerolineales bacterium]